MDVEGHGRNVERRFEFNITYSSLNRPQVRLGTPHSS
jgi:hypothetical protein